MNQPNTLRMSGIRKSFSGVPALHGVELKHSRRRGTRSSGRKWRRQEHADQDSVWRLQC